MNRGTPSVQQAFWRGKRVFVTGHTGFKGSWLSLWLTRMGAEVAGYALAPPTEPSLFKLARLSELLVHKEADVRDLPMLHKAMQEFRPDIVLHLAAQPLVRLSYDIPVETYATNVMGTVHVLEAARQCPSARAVLVITSDKCYQNVEQIWPYREKDPMGGHDPYSNSKGCAELVTHAYGQSYFTQGTQALASVRAGNVIGGGDWAKDRLMTDLVAAMLAGQRPVIRRPHAVRPWQHVLEPLSGYLMAAEWLWQHMPKMPEAWNFGPDAADEVVVEEVAGRMCRLFGMKEGPHIVPDASGLHEAGLLRLDSTKAHQQLGWKPRWGLREALPKTAEWYQRYQAGADMREVTLEQIAAYQNETHVAQAAA